MRTPVLVIALHGTRHAAGRAFAEELRDAVASRLPGIEVHLGWVDIHDDLLDATLPRLGQAVVVPTFLTAGYHVEHDVPAAVAASDGRAVAAPHVGGAVLGAVRSRLLEAGPLGDAVVLAAAGSLRANALDEVDAVARALSESIGRPVRVGYLYAAEPTVDQAVAFLREQGLADITVATYALGPGLYQDRLSALDVRAVAHPIGVHPRLVDIIVGRYWSEAA